MADVLHVDRDFGVTLASGVSVGPGVLVYLDSNAEGQLSSRSGPVHGYAITSGAGTKAAQIPQRVACRRAGIIRVPGASFTKGATLYLDTAGQIGGSGSGLTIKVGFALSTTTAFLDLDLESI